MCLEAVKADEKLTAETDIICYKVVQVKKRHYYTYYRNGPQVWQCILRI